jgi:hypothetical protein
MKWTPWTDEQNPSAQPGGWLVSGLVGRRAESQRPARRHGRLRCHRPGRGVTDLYFDWAKVRGVAEDGAVLVRPDKHVGWRADRLADDPEGALYGAVAAILSRKN